MGYFSTNTVTYVHQICPVGVFGGVLAGLREFKNTEKIKFHNLLNIKQKTLTQNGSFCLTAELDGLTDLGSQILTGVSSVSVGYILFWKMLTVL